MKIYGLYQFSHWQGAGLGAQVAHGSEAACEAAADKLGSCSFGCYGRAPGGYQVGTCYRVLPTRRPAGPELPDDVTWNRSDLLDLLNEDNEE